jgi:hypothetical protein
MNIPRNCGGEEEMLPDNTPNLSQKPESKPEVEPISAAEAEAILEKTLQPYLTDGWHVLDRNAYSARLTRGTRNLDIRVDLLGQIETQESGLTPLQESGRLTAWILLITSLLVALAVSTALGIL